MQSADHFQGPGVSVAEPELSCLGQPGTWCCSDSSVGDGSGSRGGKPVALRGAGDCC